MQLVTCENSCAGKLEQQILQRLRSKILIIKRQTVEKVKVLFRIKTILWVELNMTEDLDL